MKVELINQHGQAMLAKPVYLKPSAPTRLVLEIADEYVAHSRDWYEHGFTIPEQVPSQAKALVPDDTNSPVQRKFNAILGPLAMERPAASIGDDHQMLLEALEEKYSGR